MAERTRGTSKYHGFLWVALRGPNAARKKKPELLSVLTAIQNIFINSKPETSSQKKKKKIGGPR